MEKIEYRIVSTVNGKLGLKVNGRLNYNHMPRQVFRDNKKGAFNPKSGGEQYSIRVPSLRRNKSVWVNFYRLYPDLEGKTTYRGCKLKKI